MLVQFLLKNYKVFKEKQVFSMLASTKYTSQPNHTVRCKDQSLLTGAVLYGANASGKSALVEAMTFVRTFILKSSKELSLFDNIPTNAFKLSTTTETEPSEFEIIFIHKGIQYRYGFEANKEEILAEWLYLKDQREVEYFYRDKEEYNFNKSQFPIGALLTKQKMVRRNALLLSVAAQFNDPTAKNMFDWLKNFNVLNGLYSNVYRDFTTDRSKKNTYFKKNVLTLLQKADLNIQDFHFQPRKKEDLPELFRELSDSLPLADIIKTYHRKYDKYNTPLKEPVAFDMEKEESDGTQKFFHLAGPLLHTLSKGGVLIIDELNARLHTKLVDSIVALFHNPKINTARAQLIITTHDTNLLKGEQYRRDQVWFVQKDRYGASSLYSLNSFVSSQGNYEKKYLEGRYGAIPYIQELNNLYQPH